MSAHHTSKPTPSNLISFPSVSSSLHSLPQATSLKNVDLHPNMYASRAAESEAKLQKALSRAPSSLSPTSQPLYRVTPSSPSSDSSTQLTMRSKSKFST
ncbi:hypothetical protein BDN70DRAFT_879036 [Pholiota conissans]|uniref:Uncharacterized protein n=1 Tax=Pholiota conissans TaxID=109636 RepID=A0A9P5Z1V7_9AGAR|nr:hypothetical protein BDN70DRAFT_879036 [Pholiota conissans]